MTDSGNGPTETPATTIRVDDEDVRALLPRYLERRRKDVVSISRWLAQRDFESIQALGHNLRGSGGAYGLDYVSQIGTTLERAGRVADATSVEQAIAAFADWLERVELV